MNVIRRTLRALAATSLTLVLSTCSDQPLAPGFGRARLSIRPVFPANTQLGGLVLDEVHVTIVRPPQDVVLDQLVNFPSSSDTLSLDLSVPLQAASEDLQLTLEYRSSGTLLFSGSSTVTVRAGPPGTNPSPTIPLTYVGPGATIATLDLQPKDSVVTVGGTLPLRISARDAQNNAVASFYISWSSSNPGIRVDGAGLLTAGPARAVFYVKAVTPSGVADSARMTVVPLPTQVQKDSGDAQSALPGQPLVQPLVVRVLAADGLGVRGVPVVFAAATGGGSVDSANVVTDSAGRARTRVTLGGGPAESFTATAAGLAPVTFTATANVLPVATVTLAAGGQHACQLRSGAAFCWGDNTYGQLGDGTRTPRLSATPVGGGLNFSSIVAGQDHTCALTAGGQAYCWGHNLNGALGDGTTVDQAVPTAVSGGLTYASLTAGTYYTCGLTGAGKAYCWGNNGRGNLGDGTTTFRTAPTPVTGGLTFTALAAGGDNHTCGLIATGEIYCWGYNFDGELGDSSFTDNPVPSRVASGSRRFTTIAAATFYNCALDTSGAAYCWGDNNVRELGDGSSADQPFPVPVVGGRTYTGIRAGVPGCGIDPAASQIYCWGFNPQGQIGDGTTSTALSPVLGAQGQAFTILSLGPSQSCGVSGGVLRCWGQNSAGQLGDGSTVDRLTPTAVRGPATAVAVNTGNNQSAAVGTAVAVPPAVVVRDATGALPGIAVTFTVASGGGSATGATAVTDAAGVATVGSWILGAVAGANTLSATADAPGLAANTVTFTATGTAAAPVATTWTGAAGTNWSTAGNWSSSAVPGATDSVDIPAGTPNGPTLGNSTQVRSLTVRAGATLTISDATLTVSAVVAAAGQIATPTAGLLSIGGPGALIAGNLGSTSVTGPVTLSARVSTGGGDFLDVASGGNLTLAGHTLEVGSFSTSGTGILTMNNVLDSVIVHGNATFGGGSTAGTLAAGVLRVEGNFVQDSTNSPQSFAASGTHKTVLGNFGTTASFASWGSSAFQDLDITPLDGDQVFLSNAAVLGDLRNLGPGALQLDTTVMVVQGNASSVGGWVNSASGNGGVTLTGTGRTLAGDFSGIAVLISGTYTLTDTTDTDILGISGGGLTINGQELTSFSLSTVNGGTLTMTNPLDSVFVLSDALFAGGSTAGRLTDGAIVVDGNFSQGPIGDPAAFAPSGTHSVILQGTGVQDVGFANPGAAASHFQDVAVANTAGGVTLGTDVFVLGQSAFAPASARVLNGIGTTLHLANLDISGPGVTTFDNLFLNYDSALGGTLTGMDNVTFQNYSATLPATSPVISIRHPGAATPIIFSNLTFAPIGAGVTTTYVEAIDSDGAAPNLAIQITSNVDPVDGPTHTIATNGATVTWYVP